jgi:WD40 repeat protein
MALPNVRWLVCCAALLAAGPASAQEAGRADPHGDPLPRFALARLGSARFQHGHSVQGMAYTADGKRLAAADAGGAVVLWDTATGRAVQRISVAPDRIESFALSADGRRLLILGFHGVLRVFDMAGKELPAPMQHSEDCLRAALSPDGKRMAALRFFRKAAEHVLEVWDVDRGECAWSKSFRANQVTALAFAPDSKGLAVSVATSSGGRLEILDAAGKLFVEADAHKSGTTAFAFDPDGKRLAAGYFDGSVSVLDAATGKLIWGTRRDESVRFVAFHPGGTLLAACGDGWVISWDLSSGPPAKPARPLGNGTPGASHRSRTCALAPDGKTLAVSEGTGIWFWDVATGKATRAPDRVTGPLLFSGDGAALVTCDPALQVWDAATGQRRFAPDVRPEAVPADGAWTSGGQLVVRETNAEPRAWELKTGKEVTPAPDSRPGVRVVPMENERGVLALGGRRVSVLEPPGLLEKVPLTYSANLAHAVGLRFHHGTHRDPYHGPVTATVWDAVTGRLVNRWPLAPEGRLFTSAATALAPDGRLLAVAYRHHPHRFDRSGVEKDPHIQLWHVASGRRVAVLGGFTDDVYPLTFSPDGRLLASGGEGGMVRLWDALAGKPVATFPGHIGPVTSLAFAPHGRALASASDDGTALLWDVPGPHRGKGKPTAGEVTALWDQLASEDAARAERALWRLASAPELSLPLLRDKVRPAPADLPRRVARLTGELDSAQFAVREKATKELAELGDLAEPALRAAHAGPINLEARQRVGRLLERLAAPPPNRLRALRAIAVLEQIGTAEARRLLEDLAGGWADARDTADARAALARLAGR